MYCIDAESKKVLSEASGAGCIDHVLKEQGIEITWTDKIYVAPVPMVPFQPVLFEVKKPHIQPWYKIKTQVFSPPEVQAIIDHMSNQQLKEAGVGMEQGGVDKNVRRSNIAWMGNELPWVTGNIQKAFQEINNEYFHYEMTGIYEQTQYTTYDGTDEGFYDKHMDYGVGTPLPRKLSMVVLLSDQNDYEGGELEIHTGVTPETWKLSKGDAIIFPSFIVHKVAPITKGHRISLVQWAHGPEFK